MDEKLPGHFDYATNSKDRVVNTVRNLVGALDANLSTPLFISNEKWDLDFIANHGISSTYLYDETLRAQVVDGLIRTGNLLESNCLSSVMSIVKNENLVVTFSAENSTGNNLKYEWDFGDGKIQISTEKMIEHSYTKDGKYIVTLKVFNDFGESGKAIQEIIVKNNDSYLGSTTICHSAQLEVPLSSSKIQVSYKNISHNLNESFPLSYFADGTCECRKVKLPKYINPEPYSGYRVQVDSLYERDGRYFGSSATVYGDFAEYLMLYRVGTNVIYYFHNSATDLLKYNCLNLKSTN